MRTTHPFYSQRLPGAVFDKDGRKDKANKILAVLLDYFRGSMHALRVLDLGCSSGIITNVLAPYFNLMVGTDIDVNALEYARNTKTKNTEFFPSNAASLPFKNEAFDVVICAHVYEHVPDSGKLMEEIHRVLKQGGVCFFAAGNRFRLVEPHYRLPFLSILPSTLADIYLRVTGRGSRYDEKHLPYWGLRRLVSEFQVLDYTSKILRDPQKYFATDLCKMGSLKHKSAIIFSKLAYWLVPTYIFLLKKVNIS
jgi:2-polyprenyl-3-methyl-5-hydroxy-6-metoxy-1,4-benzoquinol methylase